MPPFGPFSLKKTSSPRRRSDLPTLHEPLRPFHCPHSLMGSQCPKCAKVFLVSQVQLIRYVVQASHLYLVPKYLLATLTILPRVGLLIELAEYVASLLLAAVPPPACSSGGAVTSPRTTATASATTFPSPEESAEIQTNRSPFFIAYVPSFIQMPPSVVWSTAVHLVPEAAPMPKRAAALLPERAGHQA